MRHNYKSLALIIWPAVFLLLGTTWLWAPQINHLLSARTSLISQYEAPGQTFSWLFRLGDILASALLLLSTIYLWRNRQINRIQLVLLATISIGSFIDPVFASNCRWDMPDCRQNLSIAFAIHALETTITSSALFIIAVYDAWLRRRLASIFFVVFQALYGLLLLSQLASHNQFNTISQYIYQLVCLLWLAWFVYGFLEIKLESGINPPKTTLVRSTVAAWAFLNGVAAIIISLTHIHLLGSVRHLFFAGDNAWLAQHGVIIGIALIYISRHLWRGELRARQIFMLICALEVIKYSLITPSPLLTIYLLTFCGLFIVKNQFYRGTIVLTWENRLKEATFMAMSLLSVVLISLLLLDTNNHRAMVAAQAIDNFFDYGFSSKVIPRNHLSSVLLAHTITVFIFFGVGTILWILFRPYNLRPKRASRQSEIAQRLLEKYSTSAEDYFKIWPKDKQYFWGDQNRGFIAYKIVGPTSFALADPIAPAQFRRSLLSDFIASNQSHRLKTCFLVVTDQSLPVYEQAGLNILQIGSSALIDVEDFMQDTVNDKWWRWQKNRAAKAGYEYALSRPPHPKKFLAQINKISDAWLKKGGHKERGFALGYFDIAYLNKCQIHYLTDKSGRPAAFTNRLPTFNNSKIASVDLLRYMPDAQNSMQFLLLKTIEDIRLEGKYKYFDLGFVPFASSDSPVVNLAKMLSVGRFSSAGLEQFKNKFDPQWQPNFMAYDGDLADLASIAINLEKSMEL